MMGTGKAVLSRTVALAMKRTAPLSDEERLQLPQIMATARSVADLPAWLRDRVQAMFGPQGEGSEQ